jgi:hypothetical protein
MRLDSEHYKLYPVFSVLDSSKQHSTSSSLRLLSMHRCRISESASVHHEFCVTISKWQFVIKFDGAHRWWYEPTREWIRMPR